MVLPQLRVNQVNRAVKTLDGAAGKSINVAKVLKELGEQPLATGFLGGDRGEHLRNVLLAKGIGMDFVIVQARTRLCITVLDESTGTQTELVEESPVVTAQECDQLMQVIRLHLAQAKAVVMSGTIAPGAPRDLYAECTRLARDTPALAVVDAQGQALAEALKAKPDLVKPNRTELAATVGSELKDEDSVVRAMRELNERGAANVVVTAGKEATLAYDGRSFWRIQNPKVTVLNAIGSGDAFTGALVWRLLKGDHLGEACRWGAAAGAANTLTLMPGELSRETVAQLAKQIALEPITPSSRAHAT